MNPPSGGTGDGRIVFLDYLRVFAFTSVLLGHKFYESMFLYVSDGTNHITPRQILGALMPLFHGGGAGVVVFFLVSGYIITHVLQTESLAQYAVKRIFRIYPLYIAAVFAQMAVTGSWPPLTVLLPRLLLIGDLFNTPYALDGVEWTLRVEVMFYVYMGVLRVAGALHQRARWLPWIYAATIGVLGMSPIVPPATSMLLTGYVNIYSPFLLLGSLVFLYEKRRIRLRTLALLIGFVLMQYYHLIETHQPNWVMAHFATLATLLFLATWALRTHISANAVVLFLSDLTYAVYLFHNWLWEVIQNALAPLAIPLIPIELQTLIGLLVLCSLASRFIEKPAIRLARALLARSQRHSRTSLTSALP